MKALPVLGLLFILAFNSCQKEPLEPVIPNEEELITRLEYHLTPENGGETLKLVFIDLDGDGGAAPTQNTVSLNANTTYNGQVYLWKDTEEPAESITEEIQEEDEEHQFFFESNISGLSVAYDDLDEDGLPVGLNTKLSTGNASNGYLRIILRHEPNKSATGVADGQAENAGGETDIELDFELEVI